MYNFVRIFKALGQPTRLKIIKLLAEKELCVCELEFILNLTQSAVSQHLRVLKEVGLVLERREGQWVFYSLDLEALVNQIQEFPLFLKEDLAQIGALALEREKLSYLEINPIASCRPRRFTANKTSLKSDAPEAG
ncbi:ArsR/SmtB family transcription factor [Calderihabitans maritimus]|uniref:Regulatory protein ArsR n=1 Tax=Calderihabitans maritimus TaxID=1246530 RepID=A0A1Z5HNZ8_9FIRM|nr:metalloregulator ArsR/SmtB family transcription factor [Calderihabitans maritimus]GAW91256.1 regulatory protein ArsR [Calderihabitans maritimus]